MITVTTKLQVRREYKGRKRLSKEPRAKGRAPAARVPHISRLIALAIKFQAMLRDGLVRDQTELARLARVTQPRMTQILNLCFLAPDIQEAILFLDGDTVVSEKVLRPIAVEASWAVQRNVWQQLDGDICGHSMRELIR